MVNKSRTPIGLRTESTLTLTRNILIISVVLLILIILFLLTYLQVKKNISTQNTNSKLGATVSALLISSQKKLNTGRKLSEKKNLTREEQDEIISNNQSALNDARDAATARPDVAETWINLSRVYRQLIGFGQNADQFAEYALGNAIKAEPSNYVPYFELGKLYIQLNNYPKAENSLKKAIELNHSDSILYSNLGYVYKQMGNAVQAKQNYLKALTLLPKDAKDRPMLEQELRAL